jgi:excinuclease UvrABC helicase subunit UvrB
MLTDTEYETEWKIIQQMFPDAKFTISIALEKMNKIITNNDIVVIQLIHNCYCYEDNERKNEYVLVKNDGNGITYKNLIDALIKEQYDPNCSHYFLENFYFINEITLEPFFGS